MTKTAEIVERLRSARYTGGAADLPVNKDAADAADHLEALEARMEKAREGLAEILDHCANTGRGNEIVDSRIVDRVDDTAVRTLSEIDDSRRDDG